MEVDYGSQDYWEAYYAKAKKPMEWLVAYSDIKQHLRPLIQERSRILEAGCGSSSLAPDMVADGFLMVVAFDYAPAAVEVM